MTDKHSSIEDLIEASQGQADRESPTGKLAEGIEDIKLKEIEQEAQAKAAKEDFEYINLIGFPITPESLTLLDEKESKKLSAICFYRDSENLRISAVNPNDKAVQEKIAELEKKYFFKNTEVYLISQTSLNHAIELYKNLPKILPSKPGVEITAKALVRFKDEIENIDSFKDKINKVNMTDVITLVIAAALKINSSDIHIEAGEKAVSVRLRVDGVLQDTTTISKEKWRQIVSRLKVLAKAKINVSDKPQDGRFTIFLKENEKIDVRTSFLPTSHGESVVMRLLKSDVTKLDLKNLGMRAREFEIVKNEINKPNGLILSVGPTGSGKTTTLYAILNRLNRPGTKIVTMEDPVEYSLEGINQSQVDESKGHTFAKGLRSILRQDPDIIMIGEIRDLETAEIAIQSSLTGHLVLSTLHTNDAAGVIPRLLDLGVKSFLLTPSINAIMAQRLVRKLCPKCRIKHELSENEQEKVKKILAVISPKANIDIPNELPTMYKAGKGCPDCNHSGYTGRTGIFEIFTMDNKLKEMTSQGVATFKILEQAIESGMITMLQDGVLKAMDGITSLEEVYDAIGKMEYIDDLYDIVTSKTIGRGIKIEEKEISSAEKIAADFNNSGELISNYPTSQVINIIIAAAIKARAGDIHIDPTEEGVNIRFRIDGFLHHIAKLPKENYVQLISELKNLAGFSTTEKQAAYDGRFSIFMPEKRIDCRISIITGGYGETAVLRILSSKAETLELDKLGIKYKTLEIIKSNITKTKGIIVNTGPTGSGKTTTLYAILNKLNKPDVKIITIEDPIEYSLEGIMQTQVDEEAKYTFSSALKNLLRQNPNIIMVGEIRDTDTAKMAIEASLTGHLVLSTIHANSATGAITRFAELGVERELLSNALENSIGQRLARRICSDCKTEMKLNAEHEKRVNEILTQIDPSSGLKIPDKLVFYQGKGCPTCSGIGYLGRVGLFEAINMTPEISKAIQTTSIDDEIEKIAMTQGFIPMIQDGIFKALEGETTIEEVLRVTK
ncbi:MAG: GspE/PulE family protein [bacterium]